MWPGFRCQHGPAQAKLTFVHNPELRQYVMAKSLGPCVAPSSSLLFLPLPPIEVLPVGIIAGATIGAGILVVVFFAALVFFLYRRRKGSEYRRCTATTNPPPPNLPLQGHVSGWGLTVNRVDQ